MPRQVFMLRDNTVTSHDRKDVSIYRQPSYLSNFLIILTSKEISRHRVIGPYRWPLDSPSQRASNAEHVSISTSIPVTGMWHVNFQLAPFTNMDQLQSQHG